VCRVVFWPFSRRLGLGSLVRGQTQGPDLNVTGGAGDDAVAGTGAALAKRCPLLGVAGWQATIHGAAAAGEEAERFVSVMLLFKNPVLRVSAVPDPPDEGSKTSARPFGT
jgi:hypothetical protein